MSKYKSGMYGEMPTVKIGKFTIAQMSDKKGDEDIWIQDIEGGEGGQFNGVLIEKDFEKLFKRHF